MVMVMVKDNIFLFLIAGGWIDVKSKECMTVEG